MAADLATFATLVAVAILAVALAARTTEKESLRAQLDADRHYQHHCPKVLRIVRVALSPEHCDGNVRCQSSDPDR
jgi:hypothetical protein